SFCPSFSSYSCDKLADIAFKVTQDSKNDVDDYDFEFVSVSTTASGDTTKYPIFNRDLLLDHIDYDVASERIPLKNLLMEDPPPPPPSSSSSSESDELESIEPGTYCVWTPKSSLQSTPNRCKKSKSTGSLFGPKRWRFRDLLKRSHSDGKESFVSLNPKEKSVSSGKVVVEAEKKKRLSSANQALYYVKTEGDNIKRSYLPYKQDIFGFFPKVIGHGR
ncbi:DUF1645 domain-containing protein, partial [Cephalotus follicularis]